MKLRIVSDEHGTRVETDNGHVVDNVQTITFTAFCGEPAEVLLSLLPADCEIVIDVNPRVVDDSLELTNDPSY